MVGVQLPAIAARQAGVLATGQLLAAGFSRRAIDHALATGRWRRLHPRTYVTHNGPLLDDAWRWSALLYAGNGALLSHHSAGALYELSAWHPVVHVTVPSRRSVAPQPGLVVHRQALPPQDVTSHRGLPLTTPVRTVLDLLRASPSSERALGIVATAVQRKQTDPIELADRISRSRVRWRRPVLLALEDIAAGSHSALELAFVRLLRTHRLPIGERQAVFGWMRVDMAFAGVVIELDGRLGHDSGKERWRDMDRDNFHGAAHTRVLRFGWFDVTTRPCAVAGLVAATIGHPARPCASCRGR